MLVRGLPDLEVQEIVTFQDLESLRSEWNDLWIRDTDSTPFQSPAWPIPWWKHLGHRRSLFYLSGFEPRAAEFSPGTLLIGHALEQAIREGCIEFDFLRGDESYKHRWGAQGRLNYRRVITHRAWRDRPRFRQSR